MIEVINIRKSFNGKEVIKGITAKMNTGECNLIIGKSGAGKTVLLKCIIGLFKPDSGDVLYDGVSFNNMSKKEVLKLRQYSGMLFQGAALFDSMTVLENVMFPLEMFSRMSAKQQYDRACYLLDRVGLINAKTKYPSEISGGMMKRVAIARAIALGPKYLFCDEPNSGLDPLTAQNIDILIQKITKEHGITTIVNTHDMNTVKTIGDKIFFVDEGIITWSGNSGNILRTEDIKVQKFINTIE